MNYEIALRAIFFDLIRLMLNTLIGQKVNQSQDFLENGMRIPVTEISVVENSVVQVKTADKDNYSAVQLGTGSKKKPNKALVGHAKKGGLKNAPSKIKEVSFKNSTEELPNGGDVIKVEGVFKAGDKVQITGVSKGKGFAGVVKRHGFSGGPKTHGQSDRHRAPGSIGQGTTPGRVYKGKRMAGRMGQDTVTVRNLTVVDVDAERNLLYVSGLVPGHRNSWVYIKKTGEDKKFVPLLSAKEKVAEAEAAAEAVEEPIEVKTEEVIEAPVVEAAEANKAVAEGVVDPIEEKVEAPVVEVEESKAEVIEASEVEVKEEQKEDNGNS